MPAPTLAQVQALHKATQAASARFAGYNFRTYFQRRTDQRFAPVLASLGDTTTVSSGASAEKLSPEQIEAFYTATIAELPAVERAGITNAMYAHDKLVLEVSEKE